MDDTERAELMAIQDTFKIGLARLGVLIEGWTRVDPAPDTTVHPQQPLTPAPPSNYLRSPAAFFDYVRGAPPLGPTLTPAEVAGCERILKACAARNFPVSHAAYTLATEFHETAGRMYPIREYGKGAGRKYGKPGRNGGQIPYGRGDVQLTWDENYETMDAELGLRGALIANYDLALDPIISADILVVGMEKGLFTGKKLADFLPEVASLTDFSNARRIVNGGDKAALIASYAVPFQAGLRAGGWPLSH